MNTRLRELPTPLINYEWDVRQLLGFETRLEVHDFFKEHGASMHYSLDDLHQDGAAALLVARQGQPLAE